MWRGTLKDSVYHASAEILISTVDEARAWLKTHPEFPDDDTAQEWAVTAGKTIISTARPRWVVWLPPWRGALTHLHHATLVHEAFHLTAQILGHYGVELVPESEDAYAYYIGSVVAQLLTAVEASRRRR